MGIGINRSVFEDGMTVEKEHKTTFEWLSKFVGKNKKLPKEAEFYLHIVSDHLKEDPKYYEKLKTLKL